MLAYNGFLDACPFLYLRSMADNRVYRYLGLGVNQGTAFWVTWQRPSGLCKKLEEYNIVEN